MSKCISLLLIAGGIVFLIFGIIHAKEVLRNYQQTTQKHISENKYYKLILVNILLNCFFIAGYAMLLIFIFLGKTINNSIFIPVILFFGGLFVMLSSLLKKIIINKILYLVKNLDKIIYASTEKIHEQNTALKHLLHSVRESKKIDPLTLVYNRGFYNDCTEETFNHFQATKQQATLIIADIDEFKAINDTHGHHVGDLVLKHFADFLQSSVRESDLVFRYGGDEFCIIFPNTTTAEVTSIIERINHDAEQLSIDHQNQTITYRASTGIAEIQPHFQNPEDWLNTADANLYRNKKRFKNNQD